MHFCTGYLALLGEGRPIPNPMQRGARVLVEYRSLADRVLVPIMESVSAAPEFDTLQQRYAQLRPNIDFGAWLWQ